MSDWPSLQRQLAALVSDPQCPAAPAGLLHPHPQRGDGLAIYQHAWRARLVAALHANFPVLQRVLGDEDFEALTLALVQAHPPRTPSIRWLGAELPGFMAAQLAADPDAWPHPALVDLARMEWALGQAFDAADATPLDFATLSQTPPTAWPDLRVAGHPSVQTLSLDWAVAPLWRTLTHAPDAETDPPEALPHTLLVWRQGQDTHWRSLADDEAPLLHAALGGQAFAQWCALATSHSADPCPNHDASQRVASLLRRWVDDGLLCPATPEAH